MAPGSQISQFKFWTEGIITLLALVWVVVMATICDYYTVEISILGIVLFWSFLKIDTVEPVKTFQTDSIFEKSKARLVQVIQTIVSEPAHTCTLLVVAPYSVNLISQCSPEW